MPNHLIFLKIFGIIITEDEERTNGMDQKNVGKIQFSYEPSETMDKYSNPFVVMVGIDDENYHISEFHKLCKKIARLYGFGENSIEKYFGEDCENPNLIF